jgi:TonB family protein
MFNSFHIDPFDLLGQAEIYPIAVYLPGEGQPKLTIAWNSFHQNFFSELVAFFQWTRVPGGPPAGIVFRDCRVQRRAPYRAVLAAGLWHVVLFILPWPQLPVVPKRNRAFDNTELTWSGAIADLPLLNVPKRTDTPTPRKTVKDEPPVENADAYHPRQRILTDPVRPSHPRQTLVNSSAPPEPPKILTPLPNIVQIAASSGPVRPRLEISEQALANLRPKEVKRLVAVDTPAPDVPNMELRPAEISLAGASAGPARPKLEMNAGSVPRLANRLQQGEAVLSPEIPSVNSDPSGGPTATVIALSATPAPPAPEIEVPKGNLAARVSLSPEGKGAGTAGDSGFPSKPTGGTSVLNSGDAAGKSSIGISISGGSPKPNAGASGLGRLSLPKVQAAHKRLEPDVSVEDPPDRTGPPDFKVLPPGAAPEQIFSSRHVYATNVNMPNLNSVTGSWIIHFSELHLSGVPRTSGEVNPPGPLRKVDPKYPQELMKGHVEGEVILYGVVRPDGMVDSIQLVRGLDDQLDANAIEAFSRWKFRPGTRDGQPVAFEAIVHIPFRGPARD